MLGGDFVSLVFGVFHLEKYPSFFILFVLNYI